MSPPIYKPQTHTLDLTVAHYFYTDPAPTATDANGYPTLGPPQPLEVWLGTLGPLNARVYQNGELTHTIGSLAIGPDGMPVGGSGVIAHQGSTRLSSPPGAASVLGGLASTIVVVELPPMRDILHMIEVATGIDLGLGLSGASAIAMTQMTSMIEEGEKTDDGGADANADAVKKSDGEAQDASAENDKGKETASTDPAAVGQANQPPVPPYPHWPVHMPPITRGIPILFVRTADGIGYHSGRELACENVLGAIAMGGPPPTIDSWAVRVL